MRGSVWRGLSLPTSLLNGKRLVLVDFLLRHDFVKTMFRGTEVAVSL